MFEWGIEKHGGKVHIDAQDFPEEILLTIDCETDEKDNIVCVGVTGNGTDVYVYFYPTPTFFGWLRTKQLIGHDVKNAEIKWLSKYGFTMAHAYMDTKMQAYVHDSSRKDWGLKALVKDMFGVEYPSYKEIVRKGKAKLTLDKQPQEIVASYNACDVFWTHKLFQHYQKVMTAQQKEFLHKIEWPTTKLLYEVEQRGILINTSQAVELHKVYMKKAHIAEKEFKRLAGLL